jgi:hypothetical protein
MGRRLQYGKVGGCITNGHPHETIGMHVGCFCLQSRGITLAAIGVVLLLWFTPSQMHYDPELDGTVASRLAAENGDGMQFSSEGRRLLSLSGQLDLQGTNGVVEGDRLVAPDVIEGTLQPNVADEAANVHHKLKRLSSEMIRHAHRMKSTLDAEDATSVVCDCILFCFVVFSWGWGHIDNDCINFCRFVFCDVK